jgi:hypothetical protein
MRSTKNEIVIDGDAKCARIQLTQGRSAIVDLDDLQLVAPYRWSASSRGRYVATTINGHMVSLHRFLAKPDASQVVDHLSGNGLDCRRSNMKVCTQAENARNRRGANKNSKSGMRCVSKVANGKWEAKVTAFGKRRSLGRFDSPEAASQVVRTALALQAIAAS